MRQVYLIILMSLFFGLGVSNSSAEVVFTDIDDQILSTGGSIDINMDGSGDAEFTIEDGGFDSVEPAIYFLEGHHLTTVSSDEWDVLDDVVEGDMIDGSSAWFDYGDAYLDPFWGNTAFPVNSDVFLGAQFKLGGNIHFGWILVNWDGNGGLTIKSYAYESVPNTGIVAGNEGENTESVLVGSILLSSVNGSNEITDMNGTLQINAVVLPQNADDTSVIWSVLNFTGEAEISQTGLLSAVADGTVRVKATANDGSGVFGQLDIEIRGQEILVTSIVISADGGVDEIAEQGGTLQMSATVLPQNASNSNVIWSVENETGEATISVTGELTAIADGTVLVMASAIDGSDVFGEFEIHISNQTVGFTSLMSKSLNIYPNPVADVLYLEGFENKVLYRIYTVTGKLVLEANLERGNRTISTASLENGVYLLEIVEGINIYRQQIVKK